MIQAAEKHETKSKHSPHMLQTPAIVSIQQRIEIEIIPRMRQCSQRLYGLSTLQRHLPLLDRALHDAPSRGDGN
jgi:hypothetical protein